ncbi:MAG: NAD-binding protein [Pirellulaceae bacterium]
MQLLNRRPIDLKTKQLLRQVVACFAMIAAIFLIGTSGYVLLEGWSLLEGAYMTIITMATVGFSEVRELSSGGRIFTSILIFFSIIGMSFWTASITTVLVTREISGTLLSQRMRKMASKLKGHTILVGASIMTETIMLRLAGAGQSFVLIEPDHEKANDVRHRFPEAIVIEAEPRDEFALGDANLISCKSVVAAVDNDFDNLLIAMSVKEIAPYITVIARANDPQVASRMAKIGVDQVICPFQLSGEHVATILEASNEAPVSSS